MAYSRVVDEFRELFPKINTTVPIDEKIREEVFMSGTSITLMTSHYGVGR